MHPRYKHADIDCPVRSQPHLCENPRIYSAATSVTSLIKMPYTLVISIAVYKVFAALSCLSAPIFCAASADTVASMEDGTINAALINFSTIPTAAAGFKPRWFAMIVITINATWIKPSCNATGTPIESSIFMTDTCGLKSFFVK